jgi:hypothetical protein
VTNPAKDHAANAKLTDILRRKCSNPRLRVMRIRWGGNGPHVEVIVQIDHHIDTHEPLGTFVVPIDASLGLRPPMNCLDDDVVMAVGDSFPCDHLRARIGSQGNA